MFNNRRLIIATKHKKENVIAPIFEKALGVNCFTVTNLDTDELGTFSGEIDRIHDPITTVRNKCLMAMELTKCDLAIASEGSFGPHPSLYFASADDELLMFIDKRNDLEVTIREISVETNFSGREIIDKTELDEFLNSTKFPSHGLIIRKSKDEYVDMVKGIHNIHHLHDNFNKLHNKFGKCYVETDMRAMHNPMRMKIISSAAQKLADKIKSTCPNCKTPGFGITSVKAGLPCEICHFPTRSTLSYIYSCQKCNHQKEDLFPKGKKTETPMFCDNCNP